MDANFFYYSILFMIDVHRQPRACARVRPSVFFSSPEHEVLRVSYCDHSPSVGVRRPSVSPSVVCSHFLVYTLASTNIKPFPHNDAF